MPFLAPYKGGMMSWSYSSRPLWQMSRAVNSLGRMALHRSSGMNAPLHGAMSLHVPKQIHLTIRSVAELRNYLLENLDRFDVISFDVFDTLLERRINPPDVVKERSSAFLSQLLHSFGLSLLDTDIFARRNAIASQLRRSAAAEGFDAEYKFVVLIEKLVADCAKTALSTDVQKQIVEKLIQHELELERQVLTPNAEMAGLFAELSRNNKRIILSSDMYLSAEQIRRLLCVNGLPAYDTPLYVSGDLKLCKGTGRLFRHWIESERVDPRRAIHIGDNEECDFLAARAVGLNAIHFVDSEARNGRENLQKLHRMAERNELSKGKYALALCEQFKKHRLKDDFFFSYGSRFLGPVFAVAMHRLVEQVREYGMNQLLFTAREGFIFKKIYERFAQSLIPHDERPETVYAYFSRHSTALASVQRFTSREVELGMRHKTLGGLDQVLSAYGLPQEPFASIAAEYGISLNDPIHRTEDPQLTKFLSDNRVQSAVAPLQRAAAAKLEAYLTQCGFWGRNRKVGMVDVGWEGTMQFNLLNAFGQRQDFPQLFGFYLGRRRGLNLLNYSPSFAEGLLYDYRNYSIDERMPLEFIEIFEEAARAPHGSVTGYRLADSNNTIRAILKQPGHTDRDIEIQNNPQLAVLQQGILDFAERYLEAVQWTGYRADQIKPYVLATATRFVCLPRKYEVQEIVKHLQHSEDFGVCNTYDLGMRKFNPLRLSDWQKVKRAFWRQGSLAQTNRALAWFATIGRISFFSSW
jgi:predicted HAD superfamily hydrolase